MTDPATDPVKTAMLDWLLGAGQTIPDNHYTHTATRDALAVLAAAGVDYDRSDTPTVSDTLADEGDSFNKATYVKAFSARIYPLGAGFYDTDGVDAYASRYASGYTFSIPEAEILSVVITQVAALMGTGPAAWQDRATALAAERAEVEARWAAKRAVDAARTS